MLKFKELRQHYVVSSSKVWNPKKPYDTVDDIKRDLGFRFKKTHYYKCEICYKLHTSSYPSLAKANTS